MKRGNGDLLKICEKKNLPLMNQANNVKHFYNSLKNENYSIAKRIASHIIKNDSDLVEVYPYPDKFTEVCRSLGSCNEDNKEMYFILSMIALRSSSDKYLECLIKHRINLDDFISSLISLPRIFERIVLDEECCNRFLKSVDLYCDNRKKV